MTTVGGRLRELRKKRGLSLVDFASLVNRNFSTISKIETGVLPISGAILDAVCRATGVRKTWLLTGNGPVDDDKWALLEARARELGDDVALELTRLMALDAALKCVSGAKRKTPQAHDSSARIEKPADTTPSYEAADIRLVVETIFTLIKSRR